MLDYILEYWRRLYDRVEQDAFVFGIVVFFETLMLILLLSAVLAFLIVVYIGFGPIPFIVGLFCVAVAAFAARNIAKDRDNDR